MFEKETDIFKLRLDVGYVQPGQRGHITNKRRLFVDVIDELKKPQRINSVTLGQYLQRSQDDQNKIKDVGSIVFGHFADSKRRNENLRSRTAISLDVDELTPRQYDRIMDLDTPLRKWKFFAHTTLKSSAEAPRLRIYVPLTEAIEPSKYMPLARIVASWLFDDEEESMDACDNVSFRPAQVAYLPGQLKNSAFEWVENLDDGEICDPDTVFEEFDGDWMDIAQLPVSEKRGHGVLAKAKKAEDPWEKKGLIGAFCRAYPVDKAIEEFLPDVYIPSEEHWSGKARYTYAKGSGTNGVVVEDDGRFIYSHHSTDPCGERLVNAWDMVRMHLFADRDEGIGPDVSASKRPSFKAMADYVEDLRPVRVELARAAIDFDDISEDADREDDGRRVLKKEPVAPVARWTRGDDPDSDPVQDGDVDLEVLGRSADVPIGTEEVDKEWQTSLDVDKTGAINATAYNVKIIVANDPRLRGALAYNELSRKPVLVKSFSTRVPGGARFALKDPDDGDPWQDVHSFELSAMLSAPSGKSFRGYDTVFGGGHIIGAVMASAMQRSFHPIRQKLVECYETWKKSDRRKRVETLFIDMLGCEDNIYTREAARNFFVGAVMRVFEPGSKMDFVPILQGGQGARKTSFFACLAYNRWHTEFRADLSDARQVMERITGFWIVEMGELASVRKSEVEDLKIAVAATHDTARAAYARFAETVARSNVFVGTTNAEQYLRDPTGNRRFWPIQITKTEDDPIDIDLLAEIRDLLWGEAVAMYLELRKAGKVHVGLSEAAKAIVAEINEEVMEVMPEDLLVERIEAYVDRPMRVSLAVGDGGAGDYDNLDDPEETVVRARVTIGELYQALFGDRSNPNAPSTNILASAMKKIPGWCRFNDWTDSNTGERGGREGKVRVNGTLKVVYVRVDATREEIRSGFRTHRTRWDDGGEDLI